MDLIFWAQIDRIKTKAAAKWVSGAKKNKKKFLRVCRKHDAFCGAKISAAAYGEDLNWPIIYCTESAPVIKSDLSPPNLFALLTWVSSKTLSSFVLEVSILHRRQVKKKKKKKKQWWAAAKKGANQSIFWQLGVLKNKRRKRETRAAAAYLHIYCISRDE